MNNDLQGKTALVTGAASGIAKAVALLYGQHGANVMVSDVDEVQGQQAMANSPGSSPSLLIKPLPVLIIVFLPFFGSDEGD